jgi:hypothetical protein
VANLVKATGQLDTYKASSHMLYFTHFFRVSVPLTLLQTPYTLVIRVFTIALREKMPPENLSKSPKFRY